MVHWVPEERWLLLRAHNGSRSWSFPKGVVDRATDTLLETAEREFEEETGASVQKLRPRPEIVYRAEYEAWGRPKQSTYFYAEATEKFDVVLSPEHTDWGWFTLAEIRDALEWPDNQHKDSVIAMITACRVKLTPVNNACID